MLRKYHSSNKTSEDPSEELAERLLYPLNKMRRKTHEINFSSKKNVDVQQKLLKIDSNRVN